MAYSCTDFVDDVLNDMVIRSWIKPDQYGPDDPQAQCDAVLGAIGEADVSLRLAADAKQFHAELLDAVETLTGIAEQHGASALECRLSPDGDPEGRGDRAHARRSGRVLVRQRPGFGRSLVAERQADRLSSGCLRPASFLNPCGQAARWGRSASFCVECFYV